MKKQQVTSIYSIVLLLFSWCVSVLLCAENERTKPNMLSVCLRHDRERNLKHPEIFIREYSYKEFQTFFVV